jgi:branched-subunit amino acid transport protein
MRSLVMLALAGAVALGAKFVVLSLASRITPTPRVHRLGRHVLVATTAAIGLPALVGVASDPAVGAVPAAAGAIVGVALAAAGRPLLVTLPAAMATCALLGLVPLPLVVSP